MSSTPPISEERASEVMQATRAAVLSFGISTRQVADNLKGLNRILREAEDEGRIPRFEDMVHAAGRKLPGDRGYWWYRLRRLPHRLAGAPW